MVMTDISQCDVLLNTFHSTLRKTRASLNAASSEPNADAVHYCEDDPEEGLVDLQTSCSQRRWRSLSLMFSLLTRSFTALMSERDLRAALLHQQQRLCRMLQRRRRSAEFHQLNITHRRHRTDKDFT